MFKAFNLQGFDEKFVAPEDREAYVRKGRESTAAGKTAVTEALKTIASSDAVLDGQQIQDGWFPNVEADVMLSHSHRDENAVLLLAGWLSHNFGIKPFVDSSIWGYAGDLLRMIDNTYCRNPDGETYSYELRNQSTSHVHMLLTTALGMMIHKTECLILVNTPSSIATKEVVKTQTFSPWIYAELTMAGIVEEVEPQRRLDEERELTTNRRMAKAAAEKELKVIHTVRNMSRFRRIDPSVLRTWEVGCGGTKGQETLDILYKLSVSGDDVIYE